MKLKILRKIFVLPGIVRLFITFLLVYAVNEGRIDALVARNIGMLRYAHAQFTNDIQPKNTWITINSLFAYDVTANPGRALSRARLASTFFAIHNFKAARDEKEHALALIGSYHPLICDLDPAFLIKSAALPPDQFNNHILDFSRNFGKWSLHLHEQAKGEISFTSSSSESGDCIARISVAFRPKPHQFLSLQQDITLVPSKTYRLSALVRANNIDKAWLGVRSMWTGSVIRNTKEWQQINFDFQFSGSNPETIQLIIESGCGTLEIRRVRLQAIK